MRKNRRIIILLITSILLIFVSTGITYYNVSQKKELTGLVIHTYEVMEASSQLLLLIQDLENGQRGYLLTRDESFLEPYHKALNDLDEDLHRLQQLISYNPRQRDLLQHQLAPLVEQKKQNLQLSFDVQKEFGHDSASQFVAMKIGKSLTDSIRASVADFVKHEEGLLSERNDDLQQIYINNDIVLFTSFALIGLTSLWALLTIRDKEKVNQRLLLNLRELNRNLEQKVKERTQQLEDAKNHSDTLNLELQGNLEEIKSLHGALVDANKKLVKLNEEKDHFLGITTHDLKTPLTGINSLLQLMKLDGANLTSAQQEYVVLMLDECTKMHRLITDLLDVNRIEQGITPIKKRLTSTRDLESSLQKQFATWAADKKINLFFQNRFEPETIHTDPDVLLRVLDNLVSNAIKFTQPGKNVVVEFTEKNEELVITVKDEGPGIKAEELHRLFGKFQKLSARPTGGESSSGLGLSIVKELVHLLDGNIRVESAPGKGSVFIIILPTLIPTP